MSRLSFRQQAPSTDTTTTDGTSVPEAPVPPRTGPPEWLSREVEAERLRRETEARRAMEAAERAKADAERRVQEREHLNQLFAKAEDRLERKLEEVEARLTTTQRLAAWAEHIAGLQTDELERVLRTKETTPTPPIE
jgi:hypothetical protein